MGTMIKIRNVPEALHRRLKSRAALAGMSLSDDLLSEIRQVAERLMNCGRAYAAAGQRLLPCHRPTRFAPSVTACDTHRIHCGVQIIVSGAMSAAGRGMTASNSPV